MFVNEKNDFKIQILQYLIKLKLMNIFGKLYPNQLNNNKKTSALIKSLFICTIFCKSVRLQDNF